MLGVDVELLPVRCGNPLECVGEPGAFRRRRMELGFLYADLPAFAAVVPGSTWAYQAVFRDGPTFSTTRAVALEYD